MTGGAIKSYYDPGAAYPYYAIVSGIPLRAIVPTACGLANLESLVVCTYGLWSVEFRQFPPWEWRVAWQISRQRSSERRLATLPSFDVRAIYHHNAGSNRCTNKPTRHIDSSCSDDGE
ncbi:hypothetical protein AVEN_78330-1 [Araneus ventricosus]|uniref:Uncharacterized protein n=1 Tax=Araneus ventricosus TaxID=182803 RepID=A0A4Y2D1Y9_ARAVE|nr:hypothetical protein AVEN_78330-1 [Araneus ventricosus]